jgi:hypothetical protein
MDDDAFYAVAGLVQVLFPATPGAIVGVKKHSAAVGCAFKCRKGCLKLRISSSGSRLNA